MPQRKYSLSSRKKAYFITLTAKNKITIKKSEKAENSHANVDTLGK